ncbi:MAG TPA: phospho-N-acetylmuramoyl-pentapeptide-transferase [Bacillota bacterium]|mgnify:CR=1 FL=1|jgi:phospho-N-acetylmuramoyl-pentapeptide-transferase|nr:phospho-N-acetylmuramoyl-pentapeptide-transferase [Fastidiosipila sp.]HPX92917.1 phospho-N-acetylmuramoyl-pentapeptide-transferase [Bacillota bacterium]HQB80693.1 phospho-N-acetylmuramoyl-pentapeptide-transferase [Bacillota bacterium]
MFPKEALLDSLYAAAAVLAATVLAGLAGIPLIRKKSPAQPIRDNGPQTHKAKAGTPTFGGLFFLLPLLILAVVLPWFNQAFGRLSVVVFFMAVFGAIGFADDYVKVNVRRKGLSVRQKTVLIGAASLAASLYFLWLSPVPPFILAPWSARLIEVTGAWKFLYLLFLVPFLFYMSNSINITDGVDGLLSSLMIIAALGLFAVAGLLYSALPQALPVMTLAGAMASGCLGFLLFNRYPARVFMGDTGSQALGIGFSLLTVMAGMPYLALITGFVFFFEGLSVVIQVIYFKSTGGRRIFRMSPIHHHFELGGWPETKVVSAFSLAGFFCALAGFLVMSGRLWKGR